MSNALPPRIQETIAGWLRDGEIDVFIGYEAGSVPLRATPVFIRAPEDVGRLIWDATCENNLAAFLSLHRGKRVGIMAKGCDARAIVALMQEGQWTRETLRIVGVACPGVVDPRQVAGALGVAVDELEDVGLDGEQIAAGGRLLPCGDMLYDTCTSCSQHTPAIHDALMGTFDGEDVPLDDAHVRAMEALDADARWDVFSAEMSRCNLCFACRNACPMCYCNQCFVDHTAPRWVNETVEPHDVQFFQIMRTFHLAGRCVGCGACTRACPQGVNLRLFLDKLRLDVAELFGYEAGVDPEAKPPLATYREDDPNDFVIG